MNYFKEPKTVKLDDLEITIIFLKGTDYLMQYSVLSCIVCMCVLYSLYSLYVCTV